MGIRRHRGRRAPRGAGAQEEPGIGLQSDPEALAVASPVEWGHLWRKGCKTESLRSGLHRPTPSAKVLLCEVEMPAVSRPVSKVTKTLACIGFHGMDCW